MSNAISDRIIQIANLAIEIDKSAPLPFVGFTNFERTEVAAGLALAVSKREAEKAAAAVCTVLMNLWVHDDRTDTMGWAVDFFTPAEIMKAFDLAVNMNAEREADYAK